MAKVIANRHQPVYQMPSSPMAVKTKRFGLDKNQYVRIAMRQIWDQQKMWVLVPLGLLLLNAILNITKVYPNYWIYVMVILGAVLYVGFWWVQFKGVTQLEQYKQLFEKYIYEIDSRQILVKLNAKEGGVIEWSMIKSGSKEKDAYILNMEKGQFLHFPTSVFNSDHDLKMFERVLRQKNLITDEKK